MKTMNDGGELGLLAGPRLHLLPDDGVGRPALRVARSPPRRARRCCASISWSAIEPSCSMPSAAEVGDDHARVLARDVGEDHVAVGRRAASGRWTMLQTAGDRSSASRVGRALGAGATIRRWITGGAYCGRRVAPEPRCKMRCSRSPDFPRSSAESAPDRGGSRPPFRPTPTLALRTHVPRLTTRRQTKRSLRELMRGAVGTALEFATLGEATLGPAPAPRQAPRPAAARHAGPAAPTAVHPHRRHIARQLHPRRGGTVRPRAQACRTPVSRPASRHA